MGERDDNTARMGGIGQHGIIGHERGQFRAVDFPVLGIFLAWVAYDDVIVQHERQLRDVLRKMSGTD